MQQELLLVLGQIANCFFAWAVGFLRTF